MSFVCGICRHFSVDSWRLLDFQQGGVTLVVRTKHWLTVKEFAPHYGRKPSAIYEQIRTGGFPFVYRRTRGDSGMILISARDFGLIPEQGADNSEAQVNQVESLVIAA